MYCSLKKESWIKDLVERLVTSPTVTIATQEGEAELPQFLLLLAGVLDGPVGEALAVESPVVIAPEVPNAAVAALVSLLSSGRTPSRVSVTDEAALKDLTSNLGIVCNFSRESNALVEQVMSRGSRAVEGRGHMTGEIDILEVEEEEDISDERYAKMHKKGEMWEKKVDRKQQQSARWKLRKEREMGKKKGKQVQQRPGDTPRIRLGPDPQAITHIFRGEDDNVLVTVFGRVVPTNQDAKPFELPWLENPVSTKRKSSGLSKKPVSKQLKEGGNRKNGLKKAKVQETEAVVDTSGGNDVKDCNTGEEEEYVDRENNTRQGRRTVARVIPRIPCLERLKKNSEGIKTSAPKRGKQASVVRVEDKAKEKSNKKTGEKFSSRQEAVGSLVRCKCCAFKGSGSALLKHLFIHFTAEMKERYREDVDANRCTECGFRSSSTRNKYHQKRNMLRHIGVSHKKILKFMEI